MRESLFRGKRIADDKWTYGYLFRCWGRCYLLWGMNGDNPIKEEVYPETVGQYTGLTDKNGKGICEGDILKVYETQEHAQNVSVSYENGQFVVSHYALKLLSDRALQSEVIGNIHDNPELLEVMR